MNSLQLTAGLAGVALTLTACTSSAGEGPTVGESGPARTPATASVSAPATSVVLAGGGATGLSVSASEAVWISSSAAITVAPERASIRRAGVLATSLSLPVLVLPKGREPAPVASASGDPSASPDASAGAPTTAPDTRVDDELERLGATQVLHVGPGAPDFPGREVVLAPEELAEREPLGPLEGLIVTKARGATTLGALAAEASLAAAGAQVLQLREPDPRASARDVRVIAAADPVVAIGLGARFGASADFAQRVATAATGVQLPGGGQTIFDDKRYVALYGHPLTGALGVLGEQGPQDSVVRARAVAQQYESLTDDTIVPAFEIIATVAAGGAGDDGNYSNEWDIEVLRPLVDAAGEAGIYVVLDLQSGRSAFLPQAKLYEELLVEPHVGLALDPEWRLQKGQLPLRQIGSVSAAEINRTMAWLADLTAERDLPQKMVLLHQFRTDMITDRADLDLSHDELAVIVQMDGDGTLGQKLDTWLALRADAAPALRFGWKNFYDEDEPTPSPATTFGVEPTPWFVSYQ